MRKWLGIFRRPTEVEPTVASSKYVQRYDAGSNDSSGVSFKDDLAASLTPAAQRVVTNWGLTDAELVTLYRLYARCDQNNDGVVDLQEFYTLIHVKRITRFHDKLLHLISAHVHNNGMLGLGAPNASGTKRTTTLANNRDSVMTIAPSQVSKSNGSGQQQQPFGQNGVFTAAANRFSVFKSTGRAKIMTNTGTAPSAVRNNAAAAAPSPVNNADKAMRNSTIVPIQTKRGQGGRSHAIRDSVFDGSAETTNALLATMNSEQADKAKQLSKPVGSFFASEATSLKSDNEPMSPASDNLLSSPTATKKADKGRPSLSAAKGSAGKTKRTKTGVTRYNTRISKSNNSTFSGRVVVGDDTVELSFSEWLVVIFGFCFATPDELISLVFWRYDAKAQGSWSHSDMCRFLKHMQDDNPLMPFDTVRLLLSLVAYGEKISYMQFRELCRDLPSLMYPIIHTREQLIHAVFGEKWYLELDHRTDDVYNRISSGQHSARWYVSEMVFNLHYYLVAMLILLTCGAGARWYTQCRKTKIEDAQTHRHKMDVLRKVAHMRRTGQLSQAQQLAMTVARQGGRSRKSSISNLMDATISIKAAGGGKNASTDQQIQTLAQQMNVDEQVAQYIVMYKNAEATTAAARKQSTTRTKGRTNSLMSGISSSMATKQLDRKNSVSEFVSSFAGVTDEFLGIRDAADIAPYIDLPPETMLSLYDSDGDDSSLNQMVDCQYDELVHNEGSENSSDEEA